MIPYRQVTGAFSLEGKTAIVTGGAGAIGGETARMYARKGANLVLVDPSARAVVSKDSSASRSRNNPYHGRELPDPVVLTMWKGRVTHQR